MSGASNERIMCTIVGLLQASPWIMEATDTDPRSHSNTAHSTWRARALGAPRAGAARWRARWWTRPTTHRTVAVVALRVVEVDVMDVDLGKIGDVPVVGVWARIPEIRPESTNQR